MGEGRRRCRRAAWDREGGGRVQWGIQIQAGKVVRVGRRQSIYQTSVTYVTGEHFFFVKGAFAYLTLRILGGGAAKSKKKKIS